MSGDDSLAICSKNKRSKKMAIPKTLKHIDYDKAMKIIIKHTKSNTGWWEGAPEFSDFVYEMPGGKRVLIRPGFSDSSWETGTVSM